MSEAAKAARAAMKKKAHRMGGKGEPHEKVDASLWSPPEMLNSGAKTGMRPVSARQYKSGGKVHGEDCGANMGRKPRKSGGRALTANSMINRNQKEANEDRAGVKHIGGMKRGGSAKRHHRLDGGGIPPAGSAPGAMLSPNAAPNAPGTISGAESTMKMNQSPMRGMIHLKKGGKAEGHPDVAEDKALIRKMVKPEARTGKKDGGSPVASGKYQGTRPTGGRIARADGGRTKKGKTNINIVIDAGGKQPGMPAMGDMGKQMPPPPTPMTPPPQIGGPPMPSMPSMPPGPPPGAPMGGPPGMPPGIPPMPRKRGGRTNAGFPDMEAGAGGGLGRLEKIKSYGKNW